MALVRWINDPKREPGPNVASAGGISISLSGRGSLVPPQDLHGIF